MISKRLPLDAIRGIFRSKASVAVAIFAVFVVMGLAITVVCAGQRWSSERVLVVSDPDAILGNPTLAALALPQGRIVYSSHCAVCHGADGKAPLKTGVPDLTDRDYLFGEGRVSEIEDIVRHGIRAGDRRGRSFAYMPAYASTRPYQAEPIPPLSPAEVSDVVQSLLARSGRPADPNAAKRGETLYLGKAGCYDCHGGDAKGDPAIGAPNLLDGIWLHGDGSLRSIAESIEKGGKGYSPAYQRLLSAAELRVVAVYVASLSNPRQTADSSK